MTATGPASSRKAQWGSNAAAVWGHIERTMIGRQQAPYIAPVRQVFEQVMNGMYQKQYDFRSTADMNDAILKQMFGYIDRTFPVMAMTAPSVSASARPSAPTHTHIQAHSHTPASHSVQAPLPPTQIRTEDAYKNTMEERDYRQQARSDSLRSEVERRAEAYKPQSEKGIPELQLPKTMDVADPPEVIEKTIEEKIREREMDIKRLLPPPPSQAQGQSSVQTPSFLQPQATQPSLPPQSTQPLVIPMPTQPPTTSVSAPIASQARPPNRIISSAGAAIPAPAIVPPTTPSPNVSALKSLLKSLGTEQQKRVSFKDEVENGDSGDSGDGIEEISLASIPAPVTLTNAQLFEPSVTRAPVSMPAPIFSVPPIQTRPKREVLLTLSPLLSEGSPTEYPPRFKFDTPEKIPQEGGSVIAMVFHKRSGTDLHSETDGRITHPHVITLNINSATLFMEYSSGGSHTYIFKPLDQSNAKSTLLEGITVSTEVSIESPFGGASTWMELIGSGQMSVGVILGV